MLDLHVYAAQLAINEVALSGYPAVKDNQGGGAAGAAASTAPSLPKL